MLEIKCESELIQFDIAERVSEKKIWVSNDIVKCNIYFTKHECKFVSKDVLINYGMFKQFHTNLRQVLNNQKEYCLLTDYNDVISLEIHRDKHNFHHLRENEDFNYLIKFKFFYHTGSDISFNGFLFVNDNSLNDFVQQTELLF